MMKYKLSRDHMIIPVDSYYSLLDRKYYSLTVKSKLSARAKWTPSALSIQSALGTCVPSAFLSARFLYFLHKTNVQF